jgi:hypothetical protein
LNKNRPVKAILVDERGRDGTLWLYRLQVQDGTGRPALERLVAIFFDRQTGEVREVDPTNDLGVATFARQHTAAR